MKADAMTTLMAAMEDKARADFDAHKDRIILALWVTGYIGNDQIDVACDPPVRLRVSQARRDDLTHWNDDWLDPYWDVELVEPYQRLADVWGLWVFGTSYCTDGRIENSQWTLQPTLRERVKTWLKGVFRG